MTEAEANGRRMMSPGEIAAVGATTEIFEQAAKLPEGDRLVFIRDAFAMLATTSTGILNDLDKAAPR